MNIRTILNPGIRTLKGQMFPGRTVFTVILLVAALLVSISVLLQADPLPSTAHISSYNANPELAAARRYAMSQTGASSAFSTNPELSAVRRYSSSQIEAGNTSRFSINPELSVARRYEAFLNNTADLLSTNPELSVHRRYAATQAGE
jgi:hypothetical protein